MTPEEIKPALTPEEWTQRGTGDGHDTGDVVTVFDAERRASVGVVLEFSSYIQILAPHGAAALCLYAQPFGFTQEDVRLLQRAAELFEQDVFDDLPENSPSAKAVRSLASRIAALLPP